MTMDEEEDLPVRKRSSTQTLLVDNDIEDEKTGNNNNVEDIKIQLPKSDKARRRSSWQFIDVVDSPSYKNSADFRELYFQFPEDQVQWLYRVDNEFSKAAKVIRDSIKDHDFKETVVDIYENGKWTKYATFPPLASIQLEHSSIAGKKLETVLDGLYEVDLSSRSMKPIYWQSSLYTTIFRATWYKKIPAALGLVSGNQYTPLSERESLAAEAAMLMFYQATDDNFLASRSDKHIFASTNNGKLLKKLDTLRYTTIALGPLLNYFEIKDEIEANILIPKTFDTFRTNILGEQQKTVFLSDNGEQHSDSVKAIGLTTNTAWPIGSAEAINELQLALQAGAVSSKGLLSSIGSVRRGYKARSNGDGGGYEQGNTINERSPALSSNSIEKNKDSTIDIKSKRHIIFVIHGIGETFSQYNSEYISTLVESTGEMRRLARDLTDRNIKQGKGMESEILDLVFLPIVWADVIHKSNTPTTKKLNAITLRNIPFIRNLANNLVSDVLFYCDNVQRNRILCKVANELNKTFDEYMNRNPGFNGTVSIVGHSLGSVISFDLLSCQQNVDEQGAPISDKNTPDSIIDDIVQNFDISKLQLKFKTVDHLFCIGSPLGMFLTIRGGNGHGDLKRTTKLPTTKHYYNIFHEYDPVAYRIEPLIDDRFANIEPLDLQRFDKSEPTIKTLKKSVNAVHGAVKFMINNISNIQLPKISNFRSSFGSFGGAPTEDAANTGDKKNEKQPPDTRTPLERATAAGFGNLNNNQRLDYQLLSSDVEAVTSYVASARGHSSYWTSTDFVNFINEKIYDSVLLEE
jgi:hypothetical protein